MPNIPVKNNKRKGKKARAKLKAKENKNKVISEGAVSHKPGSSLQKSSVNPKKEKPKRPKILNSTDDKKKKSKNKKQTKNHPPALIQHFKNKIQHEENKIIAENKLLQKNEEKMKETCKQIHANKPYNDKLHVDLKLEGIDAVQMDKIEFMEDSTDSCLIDDSEINENKKLSLSPKKPSEQSSMYQDNNNSNDKSDKAVKMVKNDSELVEDKNQDEDKIVVLESDPEADLIYVEETANIFNDNDIEYLGERKSNLTTKVDDFVFIKKEIKEENLKDSYDKKEEMIDDLKQQFSSIVDKQAKELQEVKEQLKLLLDLQGNKTEPTNLLIMSKEIDNTLENTSIMPLETFVDTDLEDEVNISTITHSTPKNYKKSTNVEKTPIKHKAKTTLDRLYSPSLKDHTSDKDICETESNSSQSPSYTPNKKKDKLYKKQTPKTREDLEIYVVNDKSPITTAPPKIQFSPNDSLQDKRKNDFENDEELDLRKKQKMDEMNKSGAIDSSSSSDPNSRMATLNNYLDYDRKKRSTGTKSFSIIGSCTNLDVPDSFWFKFPWADPSAQMLSPDNWNKFIVQYNLVEMEDKIAPWICTAQPIDPIARRYWTIFVDGQEFVSRTRAMRKFNHYKSDRPDEKDLCIFCHKYLISQYHVFTTVYRWKDNPSIPETWKWMESWQKICLIHFYRKDVVFVKGRNPNQLGGERTRQFDKQTRQKPRDMIDLKPVDLETIEVPDEY